MRPGAAVRAAREARGISLRALAASLKVSPATVSAFERDLAPITVARLERVAGLLDMEAAELLTWSSTAPDLKSAPRERSQGQGGPEGRGTAGSWRDFDGPEIDPILQAAAQLFVAHGFHATSVREIAAQSRMSVAGIYHHYASKEQILVALLDFTMSEISWRLEAAGAEGADAGESFALMVESLALFHAVRGELAFLGASEMRGLGAKQRTRITALRNGVQHALDRQALAALDAGPPTDADQEDVRVVTRAVATMCTSLPSWFRPDGPLSAAEVASRYRDFALAMLEGTAVAAG